MKLPRRKILAAGIATAGCLSARPESASAQALAGTQIRLIVPFPAGGPTDIVARPLAQMLGDALKATVFIDNRGGAGGSIGAIAAAHAPPDGLTLFMATVGTHAINPALYKDLAYDPVRHFTPVALVAMAPVTIVVHPSQPTTDLASLVAHARRMPGQFHYASAGAGTPGHLTAEMFKAAAGFDIQHVPYRGSAPAANDVVAGQVPILFDPLQSVLSNVRVGNLRAIAVSSKVRSPALPDVPTVAESGYSDFETTAWWAVFAPAKLPAVLATTLAREIEQIARGNDFRGRLEPLGVLSAPMTGTAFVEFQQREIARWGKAVRASGATVE